MSKKSEDNITHHPNSIDTRVALLELSIVHINDSLRDINRKFDKIDTKLDTMCAKLDSKIDNRFLWLLALQISSLVGTLTVIAKAVNWF